MELETNVQIGDFRIESRLGTGGMGIVYKARQVSLDRIVALKVLGPALQREADKARFQREAQAVAKLNSPGIAQVYYIGQDRQLCYIAMEFIDGISLREAIDRLARADDPSRTIDELLQGANVVQPVDPGEIRFDQPTATFVAKSEERAGHPDKLPKRVITPADIRRCCELVRNAALALQHAHERGVVHRDIKPENLLLDRAGQVHLIDFGIARFFEDVTLTSTGALVGTPMYMSPEQVTGRLTIDQRTDIYSLGIVLYEILTLRRPWESSTREGVLRQIVTKPMVPVSWKSPHVPEDVQSVLHKAISKDPDDRYQTAAAFARDLSAAIEGKTVEAKPYRYKGDIAESLAQRPTRVVTASFLLFSFSLCFLIIFGVLIARLASYYSINLTQTYVFAMLLGCELLAATGVIGALMLLYGGRKARFAANLFLLIMVYLMAGFGILPQTGPTPNFGSTRASYLYAPVFPPLVFASGVYSLLGLDWADFVPGYVMGLCGSLMCGASLYQLNSARSVAWFDLMQKARRRRSERTGWEPAVE